ncbi:unnamed protein product [Absidia cylindrospora]
MIFKIRSIRGDRILGCLNLALMIATVVIGAIKSGPVPWLPVSNNNSQVTASEPTSGGFQSNCGIHEKDKEIFNRCWLSNGMWIGSIVVAFFWLLLVLYVFIQRGSDIYDDDEYEVYDFKGTDGSHPHQNMPMAITSHSPIITPLKQQPSPPMPSTTHPTPMANDYDHGYYDVGYVDYGQQQQQQGYVGNYHHTQYDAYGGIDPQHYPMNSNNNVHGTGHRYYVPALTPASIPSPRTPTTGSHSDDTTHIMADLGGAGVDPTPSHMPSKSNQVPHTYD